MSSKAKKDIRGLCSGDGDLPGTRLHLRIWEFRVFSLLVQYLRGTKG